MRVATFNIQHARRPDGVVDVGLLARACATFDVEVLALEEVDRRVRRSGWRDISSQVASACGMRQVFGAVHRIGVLGRYGNALLSRQPIEAVELLHLPGEGAPRGAIVARTAHLSVAAMHLSRNRERSAVQLDVVCDRLLARPGPHLLLGDLNRRDHEVGRLAERGFTVAGGPPTYPAHEPRLRIDHVAVTGLRITSVDAPAVAVSDHRPLVVEVERP